MSLPQKYHMDEEGEDVSGENETRLAAAAAALLIALIVV